MLEPVLCARTDASIEAVVLTVSGPLTTCDHVAMLQQTLSSMPDGFALIIELDAMTTLSAMGLSCLRDLAKRATEEGVRLLLVSESLDVRANLVLSDLDSLAPVLHSLAQARHIVAPAA
jgi:anti-anti-sigma regulatory factor